MRKLKIVVTGTGRCGTGFISKLLTSAGIKCGHEIFFKPQGLEFAKHILENHWYGLVADSSWLAAPFLDDESLQNTLVVHLVRHPKHVIESMLRVSPHTTPGFAKFAESHLPGLSSQIDPTQWSAYKYVYWNELIEEKTKGRNSIFFRIEDDPLLLLNNLEPFGFSTSRNELFSNTKYNTKSGIQIDVSLDDIKDVELRLKLQEMSDRYGYTWSEPKPKLSKEKPVIKAIICSLDNLPNLKETVSILKRDECISEIIVVNNGSIDGTKEWLDNQTGITTIHRKNKGAGPGRNSGIDKAGKCDYFLMLDGGIRPLHDGTKRMLEYLENVPQADVIGVEIPNFETDYEKAWRRWPEPITKTYQNTRLSHTAYCLTRYKAFDGLRFSEDGPFREPGWGADDDEMAYQWNKAGVVIHVVTNVHPYRHASGSFRRLFKETGLWPNQYGSVYEKRCVWLQQNWPDQEAILQWGEPYITVVIKVSTVDKTAKIIKRAHNLLRKRKFKPPWDSIPNPYSVVAWGNDKEWLDWAQWRCLRQHHGTTTIVNDEIIYRNDKNESTWTGDFRLWTKPEWQSAIRPNAHYYGLVENMEQLESLVERYNEIHPPQPVKNPPMARGEL